MAEAAISHLLANLAPLIKDEFKLLSGVREDIEYIDREFERMTAFLKEVEANGEQGPELKVCVRQIREASYEAGDVLEQFTLHLNRRNGNKINGFLHKAYFFVRTLKVRHQVATKVQKIKFWLGDILAYKREIRHNALGMIVQGSGSQAVHNDSGYGHRSDNHLIEHFLVSLKIFLVSLKILLVSLLSNTFFSSVVFPIEDHNLVGIEGPRSEIINWLKSNNNRLQFFSVVAMGGMGKTTLVKKVFDNKETRKIFKSHAWITVSKTYKDEELLKDIIRQLYEGVSKIVPQAVETYNTTNLKKTIRNFLTGRSYLLVVDDVWQTDAWNKLKYAFPDSGCGSRVLLTTRMEKVASDVCKESHGTVYKLKCLSDEMARTLFCLNAFEGQACPAHLEGFSSEILEKCEGLPLAIVAIGGLLSTKDQGGIGEWDKVNRTLGTELEGHRELQDVLLLSYNDLPYHLKVCFLYLSVYPNNYSIDHWSLVRLFIAEGFIKPEQGMTIEEVAANYLMELVNRSLILVEKLSTNGTVKAYHIHQMWREVITPRSMEQNVVTIAGAQQENNRLNNVRRLSIHDGFTKWQEIKHIKSKLRSLLIFSNTDEHSALLLLGSLRNGAKLLKVLDLRGFPLTALPDKILKSPNLKYLCLRGSKIKEIPKSIGNLQLLETLDLKNTLVTVLPDEINKLQRLRHLLVYSYIDKNLYLPFQDQIGFRSIKGIGNLSCLQKLCSIELNEVIPNKEVITEIGKLTQLRRINILKVKSDDGRELCSSLENLRDLRSLSIGLTNEDEIINLEYLSSPPQFLQTLGVKGCLENFPCWISSLHNVSKLKLRHSKLKDDPLMSLQNLPNLTELLLERAYIGESLSFESGGFPRLKKLVLDKLSKLTKVTVIEGAMPRLEKFHIFGCELLDELPSGIGSLSCLRDLQLIDLSYELITNLSRKLPNGDYYRIKHVSKVKVGRFTDDIWRQHHL